VLYAIIKIVFDSYSFNIYTYDSRLKIEKIFFENPLIVCIKRKSERKRGNGFYIAIKRQTV